MLLSPRSLLLIAGLSLLVLAPPAPSSAWVAEIEGDVSGNAGGREVAVDAAGDVIVAGHTWNASTLSDFSVIKLAGDTGTEIWRQEIEGAQISTAGHANALVVDASGDVIAAGLLDNPATFSAFTVIKLAGADGTVLWHRDLEGTRLSSSGDHAFGVAVDAAGNVLAVGNLYNAVTRADLAVVKLAAADGTELWRRSIDGSLSGAFGIDGGRAIVVDAAGDVFAAGHLHGTGSGKDLAITKLDGATGADAWSGPVTIDGGAGASDGSVALAVAASGDVIAVGTLQDAISGIDYALVKLDGATGAQLWTATIDGAAGGDDVGALDVKLDAGGDIVVSGGLLGAGGVPEFTVIRLDGVTGAPLGPTPYSVSGTALGDAAARSLVVAAGGDVIAVGTRSNLGRGTDFAVVRLPQAGGAPLWSLDIDWIGSGDDAAEDVVLHPSGDVIAVGRLGNGLGGTSLAVIRLAGADGGFGDSGVCGDVTNDGLIDAQDVLDFRAFLSDPAGSPLSPAGVRQCTSIGVIRPCDILDLMVIRRDLAIPSLLPGIAPVCEAASVP